MVNKKTLIPQAQQTKRAPYSVEAAGYKKVTGETIPRRNVACKDELKLIPEPGVTTTYEILKRSSEKFGNAKAVGYRKLVREHSETKKIKKTVDGKEQEVDKKWTFFELSEYHYMSFIEFERGAMQAGAGLRKLGMQAGDKVHLFASTRLVYCSRLI